MIECSNNMYLLFPAFFTVTVETLFWSCFRQYRTWWFLLLCAAVNLWSNLSLNILLGIVWEQGDDLWSWKVIIGEIAIVLSEFMFFYAATRKDGFVKLFLLTLLANIITFSCSFIF